MPAYDYKCPECGVIAEFTHGVNEPFVRIHYECMMKGENAKMEKQISKTSVHFKGSGFYETDYKGK